MGTRAHKVAWGPYAAPGVPLGGPVRQLFFKLFFFGFSRPFPRKPHGSIEINSNGRRTALVRESRVLPAFGRSEHGTGRSKQTCGCQGREKAGVWRRSKHGTGRPKRLFRAFRAGKTLEGLAIPGGKHLLHRWPTEGPARANQMVFIWLFFQRL